MCFDRDHDFSGHSASSDIDAGAPPVEYFLFLMPIRTRSCALPVGPASGRRKPPFGHRYPVMQSSRLLLRRTERLNAIGFSSFSVLTVFGAMLRTGGAVCLGVGFVSRPMRGVRVWWPILRQTIRLVAVGLLREIVAMPIRVRVRKNKRTVAQIRPVGHKAVR